MKDKSYEEYQTDELLNDEWYELTLCHLELEGLTMDDEESADKVAEAISRLQAYGRVLRRMEKHIANRRVAVMQTTVLKPASRVLSRHAEWVED